MVSCGASCLLLDNLAAFAALICSRSDAEDLAAVAALGEGVLSSFVKIGADAGFLTAGLGVGFESGVAFCTSPPKRSVTDARG